MSWFRDRIDDYRQDRVDARAWGSARTLADLGERTNRWLDGELRETPGHMGPPCEETADIADDLRAINASGRFVTTGSQPGHGPREGYNGKPWAQRAFLDGHTDSVTADELEAACQDFQNASEGGDDRTVALYRQRVEDMPRGWDLARVHADRRLPAQAVTLDGDRINTAVPQRIDRGDYECIWGRWISGDALDALEKSERVALVDSHWGESRHLWETVRSVVERSEAER